VLWIVLSAWYFVVCVYSILHMCNTGVIWYWICIVWVIVLWAVFLCYIILVTILLTCAVVVMFYNHVIDFLFLRLCSVFLQDFFYIVYFRCAILLWFGTEYVLCELHCYILDIWISSFQWYGWQIITNAISGFPVSPGNAEALVRWGGKIK